MTTVGRGGRDPQDELHDLIDQLISVSASRHITPAEAMGVLMDRANGEPLLSDAATGLVLQGWATNVLGKKPIKQDGNIRPELTVVNGGVD